MHATTTEVDDFPPLCAGELAGPIARPRPTTSGVHLDAEEEASLFGVTDDGPELPDVGPDGFPDWYDEYDRYQARMSLWLSGRGPLPE